MNGSVFFPALLLAVSCSSENDGPKRGSGLPLPLGPGSGNANPDDTPIWNGDPTQIFWGRKVPQSDTETKFLPECLRKGVLFGRCFDEVHIAITAGSAEVHIQSGTDRTLFFSSSAPLPSMWAENLVVYEPSGKDISSAFREDQGGGADSLLIGGQRSICVTDYSSDRWSLAGEYLRTATISLVQPYQPDEKEYNWLRGTLSICGSLLTLPVVRGDVVKACTDAPRDIQWGTYSFEYERFGEPLSQRLDTISFEISEKHLRALAGLGEDL